MYVGLKMFLLSFWRQLPSSQYVKSNLSLNCKGIHNKSKVIMPTKSISCPARLIHQCIDSIFGVVSLQISEHGFKTALPHLEPYLSQLPRELQTLLIKMAEKSLDHSYTVRTLLMIWWSCIDNGNIKDISTAR